MHLKDLRSDRLYKLSTHMNYKPVVLVILDGWGETHNTEGNAIREAKTPTIDKLNTFYPLTLLQASGSSVGLPWGEAGNSEVGHITLGTGRILYQNMPRITLSIQDGSFFTNTALMGAITNVKKNGSALHFMGLFGQGSVHSYLEHLYALLELARKNSVEKVYLHLFTDGRDSPPKAAADSVRKFQARLREMKIGTIATVVGRNWAMDRNNNWDRIEKAYNLLTKGEGEKVQNVSDYLEVSYQNGITDEFIEPGCVVDPTTGKPVGLVQDKDSVIFFNYREDRARQITKAFSLNGFEKFKRERQLDIEFVTFVEFEKDLPVSVAFPPQEVANSLGELLSKKGKSQLRIAETEKYAHVTYFFNGGKEEAWPGEDHVLIPSPVVSSFDKAPEMSAKPVTARLLEEIKQKPYDFVLVNYANADMVGHTGNEAATVKACEFLDGILAKLIPGVLKLGGCLLITADHGNAEEMKNLRTGQKDTEHSANPVPLWFITPENHRKKSPDAIAQQQNEVVGLLSDVAPTVLDIMEIEKPSEMLGSSLLPLFQ